MKLGTIVTGLWKYKFESQEEAIVYSHHVIAIKLHIAPEDKTRRAEARAIAEVAICETQGNS